MSRFMRIFRGLALRPQDAAPSNPDHGDLYFDAVENKFKGCKDGSTFSELGGGGLEGFIDLTGSNLYLGGGGCQVTVTPKDSSGAVVANSQVMVTLVAASGISSVAWSGAATGTTTVGQKITASFTGTALVFNAAPNATGEFTVCIQNGLVSKTITVQYVSGY